MISKSPGANTRVKRFLLASTALVAFAAHMHFAQAAEAESVGYVDLPTTFLSFEGGVLFNASPSSTHFDEDDEKLGDLGSLGSGDPGWQGRFELGQRLNDQWDYKVGIAALSIPQGTSHDAISTDDAVGDARASQTTSLQLIDAEIGYRPQDIGILQTRLLAGVRGLHSSTRTNWDYQSQGSEVFDKLGEFDDEVYAIGPRVGIDLTVPMAETGISLVGSASGSVLFGSIASSYRYEGFGSVLGPSDDYISSKTIDNQAIWNVEGMAGLSFDLGETADLTLGYRAAQFDGLMVDRSDIDKTGDFSADGNSSLLVHGPFARLTVAIP